MLQINDELMEQIAKNVRQGYPNEACGILVGTRDIEIKRVNEIIPTNNTNKENPKERYQLDPETLKKTETEVKAKGMEIIGIYHSHPDGAPKPSETDKTEAWPVYSYLICSVIKGKGVTAKSWELDESSKEFKEEELDILGEEMGEA